eukprot:353865_1
MILVVLVVFIARILHVRCDDDDIKSFGIHVLSAENNGNGDDEFTMRLYYDTAVYSCLFSPVQLATSYYCNINNYKVDIRCDEDGLGDYVMEIENPYLTGHNIVITAFYVNDYTFEYTEDNYIQLSNTNVMFVDLNMNPIDISIRSGEAKGVDLFNIQVGVLQAFRYIALRAVVYLNDYVYKCKHKVNKKTDNGATYDYDCYFQDWIRFKCINENLDETITLSNSNYYSILISHIAIGNNRKIDTFCVPKESENVIATSPGNNDNNICDCPGNVENIELQTIKLNANDNVPVASISFATDNNCNSESLITSVFAYYTLSLTACDDLSKNDDRSMHVIARGTNGNTYMHLLRTNLPYNGDTTEFRVGGKDIGTFVSINMELKFEGQTEGDPFCMSSIGWKNNINGKEERYGEQYFGDGVYLAGNSDYDSYGFKLHPNGDKLLYLPIVQDQFEMSVLHKSTNVRLSIHVCYGADTYAGNVGNIFVSVTGKTPDGRFESSELLSLSTTNNQIEENEFRQYSFMVEHQFVEIALISLSNSAKDMICIDEIEINDQKTFLSNYFLGSDDCLEHKCTKTMYAVVSWPICSAEIIGVRASNTIQSSADAIISTAQCSNQNRLFDVACSVSQYYETSTEMSFELQTGEVTSVGSSFEGSFSIGMSATTSFEVGIGIKYEVGVSLETSYSFSWSKSEGIDTYNLRTHSNGNSSTFGETCEGSVSVPPLNSLMYTVSVENVIYESTTLTDVKYTKCSAAFSDDKDDEDHYIYIYDIPTTLTTTTSKSCNIDFGESTYTAVAIACNEAIKHRGLEFGTYMPICNRDAPEMWEPCQCAFGESTYVTCICVDKTSGTPTELSKASVLDPKSYPNWSDWCEIECPNSHYPPITSLSAAQSLNRNIKRDCSDDKCADIDINTGNDYSKQPQ